MFDFAPPHRNQQQQQQQSPSTLRRTTSVPNSMHLFSPFSPNQGSSSKPSRSNNRQQQHPASPSKVRQMLSLNKKNKSAADDCHQQRSPKPTSPRRRNRSPTRQRRRRAASSPCRTSRSPTRLPQITLPPCLLSPLQKSQSRLQSLWDDSVTSFTSSSNALWSDAEKEEALTQVQQAITKNQDTIHKMDLLIEHAQQFAASRVMEPASKSKIGAIVSMKQILKCEVQREQAQACIGELQNVLLEVQVSETPVDYQAKLDDIKQNQEPPEFCQELLANVAVQRLEALKKKLKAEQDETKKPQRLQSRRRSTTSHRSCSDSLSSSSCHTMSTTAAPLFTGDETLGREGQSTGCHNSLSSLL